MDQVACPRCMAVTESGTPRCPVCSASLERGIALPEPAPDVAPAAQETSWATPSSPAAPDPGLALGLLGSLDTVAVADVVPSAPSAPDGAAESERPIAAFAPPRPGPPGTLVWIPKGVVLTESREGRPDPAVAAPGGPASWVTQPTGTPVAATQPEPHPAAPPMAATATPGAGGTADAVRLQEGGKGWNIRVREELGHLSQHHAHSALPAMAGAGMAGAGAMPMYGGGRAAAPALPPAPWERRTPQRRSAFAGVGVALVSRVIGLVVAAAIGIVAFGHHNWLNNLVHGGSHSVSAPAIVGGEPKVFSGPLTAAAADLSRSISTLSGVDNAVVAYYGSGTGVPDYYLAIVSGNTQGLTDSDMIGYLSSGGAKSGISVDQSGAVAHTVNGTAYTCSPYTLTVQSTSVAGHLCAWVTYNDAGVLFSYRPVDDAQMLSITDAARTAANG